jgi:catechol 2,3-dioxygenase
MHILRLAHVEIGVRDLDQAREFYVDLLGFVEAGREGKSLFLRGVEEFEAWSLCLTQAEGPGVFHIAFRVASPEDLEALERLHRELGVPYRRVSAGAEPHQGEALRVRSPDGHPLEFFYEFAQVPFRDPDGRTRLPMRLTHRQKGIPPTRIDHVNLRVREPEASLGYWRDRLGFSVSEYYTDQKGQVHTAWLRRRTGTHDVAIGRYDRTAFHHVAYYAPEPMAVIRTADLLADARLHRNIDYGPGRHGISNAFFLYIRDPFGNRIEIYHGDYNRDLDREPIGWTYEEYHDQGLSWWGQVPPERFRETNPILSKGWPEE